MRLRAGEILPVVAAPPNLQHLQTEPAPQNYSKTFTAAAPSKLQHPLNRTSTPKLQHPETYSTPEQNQHPQNCSTLNSTELHKPTAPPEPVPDRAGTANPTAIPEQKWHPITYSTPRAAPPVPAGSQQGQEPSECPQTHFWGLPLGLGVTPVFHQRGRNSPRRFLGVHLSLKVHSSP